MSKAGRDRLIALENGSQLQRNAFQFLAVEAVTPQAMEYIDALEEVVEATPCEYGAANGGLIPCPKEVALLEMGGFKPRESWCVVCLGKERVAAVKKGVVADAG